MRITIQNDYDLILTNIPIYAKKKRKQRLVGEIDLLAKKGNSYHIFEVKCSHRITKARLQLKKIKKHLMPKFKVSKSFFYCGSSALLVRL